MVSRGRPKKLDEPKVPGPDQSKDESLQKAKEAYYLSLDSSNLVITLFGGKFDHRIGDVIEEAIEVEFAPLRDDNTLMIYGVYHTRDPKLIAGIENSKPFQSRRVRKFSDFEQSIEFALKDAQQRIIAEAQNKDALVDSEEFVK